MRAACIKWWKNADPEVKRRSLEKAIRRHNVKRQSRGLPGGEYGRLEVYQRDGGLCGLCGEAIDLTVRYPHPRSFTIDHVLPLSKGGLDVLDNVQAAHFHCNTSKRDDVTAVTVKVQLFAP